MNPSLIHLLGWSFQDELYFDVLLSMKSKSAAFCCQRTTNAISFIFASNGFQDVNYLDDLWTAEAKDKAEKPFDCLGWILATTSIKESAHKAKPPATITISLGILFNTITMTFQITPIDSRRLRSYYAIGWEKGSQLSLNCSHC